MKARLLRLTGEERGAALMLVALGLVLLMGMAAFGTDLAWFYLNTSRVQRAADAASLAGVVWLPGDEPQAFGTADAVAIQNGYDDADAEVIVLPERVVGELNQLQVSVTDTVPTFFLRVFGVQSQVITRSATAEYIPPLKLGSPTNKFGNDPTCYTSNPTDCAGNFWANIHGTRTATTFGDAYSSYCQVYGPSSNACAQNTMYRDTGYLYGMIPNANSVSLETLDMTYHNDSGGVNNGDFHRTGDHDAHLAGAFPGQSVTVNVYRPDPTPLDISDNTLHCTQTYAPLPQINPDDDPPFNYAANWAALGKGWRQVCGGAINTSTSPTGIWVIQVVANSGGGQTTILGNGNVANSGLNRYSIRTSVGNIFALGDFSIYNNAVGSTTSFYLAEVPDYYRGKTFVVELYDAGESSDTGQLQPIDPTTGAIFNSGQCRVYSRNVNEVSWGAPDTVINPPGNCLESVNPGEYNGRWLKFEMDLPIAYTCTDCWWRMNYAYPSAMNDTTTWRAYMIGNPIHLVP
ncbi:MAG: pilus assembly protein TadG-related protein [Acidimicrobiia bacterium]